MTPAEPGAAAELMARAARLHFEFGLTHQEAAEQLGVSRVKVTRLLRQAREAGIVRITVTTDLGIFTDLEDRLSGTGRLREAIIVPSAPSPDEVRRRLAHGAARYLQRVLRDGMVVAVGLSRTIALVAPELSSAQLVRARFVSLVGALPEGRGSPFESTQALANTFGGSAVHLHAPYAVASADVATQLMSDPSIATTLHQAETADMALVGVGGTRDRIDLTHSGQLSERDLDEVLELGSVGDIGGRFFDRAGLAVPSHVDRRMIGLTLDQFRKIPNRLVAAAGADKVEALAAVIRGGLATVLVVDLRTARLLVDQLPAGGEQESDGAEVTSAAVVRRGRRRDG